MRRDVDGNEDVAGGALAGGRLALAADADLLAVLDARRGFSPSASRSCPSGRWTPSCTSPPVIEVAKGISSSCGQVGAAAAGRAGAAPSPPPPPRRNWPKRSPSPPVGSPPKRSPKNWLKSTSSAVKPPGPAWNSAPPGAAPPGPGLRRPRPPWSRTSCRSGRTFPAFPGCSARRRPAGSAETSSSPTCRPDSCRDGASAPARDRPSGCRPARRSATRRGSCSSLLPWAARSSPLPKGDGGCWWAAGSFLGIVGFRRLLLSSRAYTTRAWGAAC